MIRKYLKKLILECLVEVDRPPVKIEITRDPSEKPLQLYITNSNFVASSKYSGLIMIDKFKNDVS